MTKAVPKRDLVAFLQKLPRDAITFFVTFARFEYALKRKRFVKKGSEWAEADWDLFANSLPKTFCQDVKASDVAREIFDHPPEKQIVKGGRLDWSKGAGKKIGSNQELFAAIRRVRNNLFHGGKFPGRPVIGTERDTKLLEQSQSVLNWALDRCPDLKKTFWKDLK